MNPPPVPPHADVFSVGGVRTSSTPEKSYSQNFSRTPSRREPPPIPPHSHSIEADFEVKEEMRQRELEELRARAAQMEKTMRWWSDCTSNWREKWSKVRNERNQARDESRQLRTKLDSITKDLIKMKRERDEFSVSVDTLKRDLESVRSSSENSQTLLLSNSKDLKLASDVAEKPYSEETAERRNDSNRSSTVEPSSKPAGDGKSTSDGGQDSSNNSTNSLMKLADSSPLQEGDLFQEEIAALKQKLEESHKATTCEREERLKMKQALDAASGDLVSLTSQYEDLKKSRQDAIQEITKLKQWKKDRMEQMTSDLEDEAVSGSEMDKRLADLRKELEKLQAENAQEWALREKLETEKLSLERENKKLRGEISRLEDEIGRRSRQTNVMIDLDMKSMQEELNDKMKELSDLRHAYGKVKKTLQDKTAELEHARSRSEQYELEVKKLRGRIEELKRDLAAAEDEVDQQTNQVRKLQRNNDELQQQMETLTVQIEHLQARLRRSKPPLSGSRSSLTNAYEPEEVESEEASGEDGGN